MLYVQCGGKVIVNNSLISTAALPWPVELRQIFNLKAARSCDLGHGIVR